MKYIQRFFVWWVTLFRKQSLSGKVVVGCVSLALTCCICTIPLSLLPSAETNITLTPSPIVILEPIEFPLIAHSNGWDFVILRADTFLSLESGSRTISPENGVFLALVGNLENNSAEIGCVTAFKWEISSVGGGKQYSHDFSAATALKDIYNLDEPGAFLGTCLGSGESTQLFVVFDVGENEMLVLTFRQGEGGEPLNLNTAAYLAAVPTAIPAATSTATETPPPTFTPEFTKTVPVTITPTIIFISSSTPSPNKTTGAEFEVIFLTSPVNAGSNATVQIRTVAGASCDLSYTTPAGTASKAKGLGATTADSNGICSWTWKIGPSTKAGTGRLSITANGTTQYYSIVIQ